MSTRTLLAVSAGWLALSAHGNAADWPQWRGPDRTDVSTETGLLEEWPEGGPRRLWLFEDAGIGYSGFAVAGDKVYTMGGRDGRERLLALDRASGKERWDAHIGEIYRNGYGDGPRGTPAVDGDLVFGLGGQGSLVCARTSDGKVLWRTTLQELGGRTPGWGYSESVLVDEDRVIATPGGRKGAVVALERGTGKVTWQSQGFTDRAQYASVVVLEHGGKRQYVQLTMESVVGLDAANGEVLWKADWPGETAVIPTPIVRGGLVYVTSGYGVGCNLFRLGTDGAVEAIYDSEARRVMKNHHGGVLLFGDHVYGYSDGPGWVCQELETGRMVWNERRRLGKGAVSCAGGRLYCLEESSGTVVLAEASPGGWKERGRFRLEPQARERRGGRIWTHPVVSGGRLYLRDQNLVYCYDVRKS